MSGDEMGGGVVFAIAAALWIAYLLPSWMRRREYLATERTAVRLQQTLRILAETSELPDEVRVEAKARAIAEHQKVLKKAEQKMLAETRAAAAAEARVRRVEEAHAIRAAQEQEDRLAAEELTRAAWEETLAARAAQAATAPAPTARARTVSAPIDSPQLREPLAAAPASVRPLTNLQSSASRKQSRTRVQRLRRARSATSLTLLLGLLAAGYGAYSTVTGGTWFVLVSGSFVALCSIVLLARLAGEGRRMARVAVALTTAVEEAAPVPVALFDHQEHDPVEEPAATWTPQPLPKPMHLSQGSVAAAVMASIDAAAELRRAAAEAEIEEHAAEIARRRPPVPLRSATALSRALSTSMTDAAGPAATASDRAVAARTGQYASQAAGGRPHQASRFASMGVVGELEDRSMDLDAALRRRRAAS